MVMESGQKNYDDAVYDKVRKNMKVGLIQIHSIPAEVETNVKRGMEMFCRAADGGAELVVFPELWTCGYYLETDGFLAAVRENDWILEKFCELARKTHTVVVLPLPQKIEEELFIGLYVIENDGKIAGEYQKSFLWGREQQYFTHGKREYEPVETSLGKLGVLICYDIEFPEPSRILALKGAQMLVVPSVWSVPALHRWQIQLPARALDNTVFLLGINGVKEGACGHSKVVSPMGAVLAEASGEEEEVLLCEIDLNDIAETRSKIPYLKEYDMKLAPAKM